jgi:hypothetical protein
MQGRENFEYLGGDGRAVLKLILNKQGRKLWIRIGLVGGEG